MEKIEFKKEKSEKYKYIYTNHFNGDDKIIFECIAPDIIEADKMYQEVTGKNPEKQPYIGCDRKKIENE